MFTLGTPATLACYLSPLYSTMVKYYLWISIWIIVYMHILNSYSNIILLNRISFLAPHSANTGVEVEHLFTLDKHFVFCIQSIPYSIQIGYKKYTNKK